MKKLIVLILTLILVPIAYGGPTFSGAGGGSTSPGGANGSVQCNSSGSFGACSNLTDVAIPTAASLHVDDILTALGIASEAATMPNGTGSVWPDGSTQAAINQALETAVELKQASSTTLTTAAGNGTGTFTTTKGCTYTTTTGLACNSDFVGISGSITDEQLACWETTDGTNKIKSCGAKTTYTEPATNTTICRTGSGTTGACTNPIKLASFAWDGGGAAVAANAASKRCVVMPTTATVTGVYAIADASTTTHLHVYQDAFAAGARSTTVTGAVDIGATLGSLDTTLTSWDKSITAGDEICMSVEANDNAKWLNVVVYGTY